MRQFAAVAAVVLFAATSTVKADDTDHAHHEHATGQIVVDPAWPTPARAAIFDDSPRQEPSAYSNVDVFALESMPGAHHTIYLDFDGHVTKDTIFNGRPGHETIVSTPFDLDGNPATFNAAERQTIFDVWRDVADTFSPWNVNVTTKDPGVEALRKTSTGDTRYGTRVVFTPDQLYENSGGVAELFSFTAAKDLPAFVFTLEPTQRMTQLLADIASHEIGHTLGLHHHGTHTEEYYAGHNNWAPIMGLISDGFMTQWARGEYQDANRPHQHDLTYIDSMLQRRSDDHSNTTANATQIAVNTAVPGRIERTGDIDTFRVTSTRSDLKIAVTATNPSKLDYDIRLLDSNGQLLHHAAPLGRNARTIYRNTPPGTYHIQIRGIGRGGPLTSYTNYGSLGGYTLTVGYGALEQTSGLTAAGFVAHGSASRIVDTRQAGSVRRLTAGATTTIPVRDIARLGAGVTAISANFTVTGQSGPGYLTVWPCHLPRPHVSNVNWPGPSQPRSNHQLIGVSPAGTICAWAPVDTHLIVDLNGHFRPGGPELFNEGPHRRLADTRPAGTRIQPGAITRVAVAGLPAATGVALNVTATSATGSGWLAVWACTDADGTAVGWPGTSQVNFTAGTTRANNMLSVLGKDRHLCLTSSTPTHAVIDLTGHFRRDTGSILQPVQPRRAYDSRDHGARIGTDPIVVKAANDPPHTGVFINVTATGATTAGYAVAYTTGAAPDTSTVNYPARHANANGTNIGTTAGNIRLHTPIPAHLIVDLFALWVPASH